MAAAEGVTAEFQSTLPYGERQEFPDGEYEAIIISIHAPVKGATRSEDLIFPSFRFQSTLPRGSDLFQFRLGFPREHFNPRSREGATGGD